MKQISFSILKFSLSYSSPQHRVRRKRVANGCPFLRHDPVEMIDQAWKQVESPLKKIGKQYDFPFLHPTSGQRYIGCWNIWGTQQFLEVNINVIASLFHSDCIYWLYIDFGCFYVVLVQEMLFYTLSEIAREFRFIWPISLTMTCVCTRRFSNAWLLWKNLWKSKSFWELIGCCHNFYIFITSVWVFWYYYLDGKWCKEY